MSRPPSPPRKKRTRPGPLPFVPGLPCGAEAGTGAPEIVRSPPSPSARRGARLRSRIARWAALAWLAAALLPAASPAQDAEDAAFADRLLEKGWTEQAERVFRALAREGAAPDARARGELGLVRVLRVRAEAEPDAARKTALFDEAVGRYREFLKGRRDAPALSGLAELLRAQGEELLARAGSASDAGERAAQGKAALAAFEEALALLDDHCSLAERESTPGREEPGPDHERLLQAWFARADIHLPLARALEGDPGRKAGILRRADRLFEEIQWTDEDHALAWLSRLRRGMVAAEAGELGAALDHFDAILLAEEPERPEPGPNVLRTRLRIMAWHRSLEALVLAGKSDPARYGEALSRAARMEKETPACLDAPFPDPVSGRLAVLEKAKALAGLGRFAEAAAEAGRVFERGGVTAATAQALVCGWAASDPAAGPLPLVWRAESLLRRGMAGPAVEAFQLALDRLGGPGEIREFAVRAWKGMAAGYETRGLHHEAGLAFREAEDRARSFLSGGEPKALREEAAACSGSALRCFWKAWESGGRASPSIAALCEEQRDRIIRFYDGLPAARDLRFLAGREHLRRGENLEAAEDFGAVDPSSENHGAALVFTGQAYFKESERRGNKEGAARGAPDAAECLVRAGDALKRFLDSRSAVSANAGGTEGEDLEGFARYLLSRVRAGQGAWAETLDILDGFERKFPRRADLTPLVGLLRLQGMARTGRADGVEDAVRALENAAVAARKTEGAAGAGKALAEGLRSAGSFFGEAADRDREGDPEAAAERDRKAAGYFRRWAEIWLLPGRKGFDPGDVARGLSTAGGRCARARDWETAARFYEVLVSEFAGALSPADSLRARRALGECCVALARWERAVEIFRDVRSGDASRPAGSKLVFALFRLGEALEAGGRTREACRRFDEALDTASGLWEKQEPARREWWEDQVLVWTILCRKGAFTEVVNGITGAQLMYPALGGKELKPRILDILEEAKRRARDPSPRGVEGRRPGNPDKKK